ncbi:carboxyl transferase domain-containing protein, partial [Micromonospora sp. CPCC 205714]|uniref:carboxyl transferase domain-containing protein n=1 Tax=Micromonospora sp. CPCC 205714 TaxID=3122402 RepID=UPI002FEF9F02
MRRSARDLIELVIDPGSWVSWDEPVADPAPLDADYAAALAAARRTTGLDEAVITGAGRLGGRPVAVIAGGFAFLGGSIGVAAAERLTRARQPA